MARMNIYFPTQKEKERLLKTARRLGLSPSVVIRMALRYFYEKIKHDDAVRYGK